MGNFFSSTLHWRVFQTNSALGDKIEILLESNQNLLILNWVIEQWFQYHEKEVLTELKKSIGWINETEISDLEDFFHIPLFNNQDSETSTLGFVSRLQLQELNTYLDQQELYTKRLKGISQRVKQGEIVGKPEEGNRYSIVISQNSHSVFDEGVLYELRQQEAPDRNAPNHKICSHCKIYNLNYAWMHFQALKNTNDARRAGIDLLNLIQEYRVPIQEWSNVGVSMFSNDFWSSVSSARQWEELQFRERRQLSAKMRALLYIQNLDSFLCRQWINTKLLRSYAKQIFHEIQKTKIHRDVYESNDVVRTTSLTNTSQLQDDIQYRKRKLLQNAVESEQSLQSSTKNSKQSASSSKVKLGPEKGVAKGRKESQSVPPEIFRRPRVYPHVPVPRPSNISHIAESLDDVEDSDDEEPEIATISTPRKKDLKLISEIDQRFSQIVRQLRTKVGKGLDSSLLIAVQYVQNLPLNEKSYQFAISDANAISLLLSLLTNDDLRIRIAAADTLSHLAENPSLQLEICDMTGIQIILSIVQSSNHVGLTALVANILNKSCQRSAVRERLLNSRNALGILFSKVESCLQKESSSQRTILRQLLNILYYISMLPSSHLRIHEYNPIRTYGQLLDNFYQFSDELSTEEESSSLLVPIFGFIANVCKDARNVKLVNQLKLSPKIYRTVLIHQETEDKNLRRSMAVLIGRISSKSNIPLMDHSNILTILNNWLHQILTEDSVCIDDASTVLYALSRCTQWDALLDLFISNIALKDPSVLSRIIGLVSFRQDLKTIRSAMHALGLISNLSRHPSIANQMVDKGIISIVCSATLTSSIPNFVIRSLEILMHICENKVTEEILKEMSAYGTFTLLPMLMENNHIPIQIGAMQTLCAMITDDRRAYRVVKFGVNEFGLPPIILKILESLAVSFNSNLETRALELDLGKLFDSVMQLIKKLLLSESNLKFFGDPVVVKLILKCLTADRQEVQPSNFAFSCTVLSQICKELPETIELVNESLLTCTVIRYLKKLSNQPFKKNAKEQEEYEFCCIGVLTLLVVLCANDKFVLILCDENPIDMFLDFLDSKNEMIQELTSEVLSLMRRSLSHPITH